MQALRKILVPIDFSEHSRRACEAAYALAVPFGAQLDLLHVATMATQYAPLERAIWGETHSQKMVDEVREAQARDMKTFYNALPKPLREHAGQRLEWGTPYEVVTRIAREEGYDMIVVGTHGRTGTSHALMGSVAERIIRHANCPVLSVP